MEVWWVNQRNSYEISKQLGCLWAPLRGTRSNQRVHWNLMSEVKKGDIIAHCSRGAIRALSRARAKAYFASRPDGFKSTVWTYDDGIRVDLDFFKLKPIILVSEVSSKIQALQLIHGPLNRIGKPKQSYLHRFSVQGLTILMEATPSEWPTWARFS
jgi:hypothetical protein